MSIEEKFLAAVDIINSIPKDGTFQPSEDLMLKLYAYYKQSTEGPCNIVQPSIWHFTSRLKWNAWNELGNMKRELAMEKYVEELTKVIETMSYNEKISRFMSLIGPFYEVVPSEELNQDSSKGGNTRTHSSFSYPVTSLKDQTSLKKESFQIELTESTVPSATEVSQLNFSASPVRRSCRSHFDSNSFNMSSACRRNGIELFRPKTSYKTCKTVVTQQDLLILTIINLKSSLEDIVKKLDHLHTLAKSASFTRQPENMGQTESWGLGVGATAFALLWPIAVHVWCSRF